MTAEAISFIKARNLTKSYLSTPQPDGITTLAEADNLKLIGFAASNLLELSARISNIIAKTGEINKDAPKNSERLAANIKQYRLVAYVSANGTIQPDGQQIGLTLAYADKNGAAQTSNIIYAGLRGLLGDTGQLLRYIFSSEGNLLSPKAETEYSSIYKAQARSFFEEAGPKQALLSLEELQALISDLGQFTALGEASYKPQARQILIQLPTLDAITKAKNQALVLAKDHPFALRPAFAGLFKLDSDGDESLVGWDKVGRITEDHVGRNTYTLALTYIIPAPKEAEPKPIWTPEYI